MALSLTAGSNHQGIATFNTTVQRQQPHQQLHQQKQLPNARPMKPLMKSHPATLRDYIETVMSREKVVETGPAEVSAAGSTGEGGTGEGGTGKQANIPPYLFNSQISETLPAQWKEDFAVPPIFLPSSLASTSSFVETPEVDSASLPSRPLLCSLYHLTHSAL
jgi:hypothetical protein